MTRKCVLCKGTNYKRTYSFFSAPKDTEIRKKWQALIPIANYTVTDDTFICSKHFRSSDIITHWISGVPPNVITIKYKKCRLRVGAVPCLNIEDNNDTPKIDFANVGYSDDLVDNKIESLILGDNHAEPAATSSEVTEAHVDNTTQLEIKSEKNNVVINQRNAPFGRTKHIDASTSYKSYVSKDKQMQEYTNSAENDRLDPFRNCFDYQYPRTDKVEGRESVIDEGSRNNSNNNDAGVFQDAGIHKVPSQNIKLEQEIRALNQELIMEDDDYVTFRVEHIGGNKEPNCRYVSKGNDVITRRQEPFHDLLEATRCNSENKCEEEIPDSAVCESMLFEDLLEIYTEVTLPQGWAFLVTSKSHTTSVVYIYMSVPTNHIPIVEKEVYINSDMVIRCAAGGREINPFLHNLMKDGKNNEVHALSDIEELINELDRRQICEGGPSLQDVTTVETQLAHVDGGKWRHVACPVIINNGSPICSKCLSLNSNVTRGRNETARGRSSEILKDQRKEIETLQKSLHKITRHNQRLERIRLRFKNRLKLLLSNSGKLMKKEISSSNMPEIQKLMVKECLKASVFKNKNNKGYCETWIFLCLLLYVESPRMYRYMILNNYMALPSMGTIRKYLNQIKIDPQFYNLFQRSVEPYQPVCEQDK